MNTHSNLEPVAVRLQRQVDVAEQTLIHQRSDGQAIDSESIGIIYTGNVQHSIPHNLLLDPVLTPADKTLWMVMRAFITNPRAPGYIPSRDQLSAGMNCSRPTITKARNTLRIGRWMTYCRTVRDNKQRFVGDVYLLHEEPLSLQDTLELDPGYIDFLTDQAQQAGGSKQNRQFASALLKDIDRLTELRSPTQREVIERRLTTAASVPTTDDRISLCFASAYATDEDSAARYGTEPSQGKNFDMAPTRESAEIPIKTPETPANVTQGKNFDVGIESQGKNFDMAKTAENSQGKKFSLDSSSSSSSYINKYISTRAREDTTPTQPDAQLHVQLELAGLGFLVTETTVTKLHAWLPHQAHIPVIGRQLRRLPEHDARLIGYQIFGRLIAELDKVTGVAYVRNLVGFSHALVQRLLAGEFSIDEWGNQVREAIEEGEPHFLDL